MSYHSVNPKVFVRRGDVQLGINNSMPTDDGHPLITVQVFDSEHEEETIHAPIRLYDLQQLVKIISELNLNYGAGSLEK